MPRRVQDIVPGDRRSIRDIPLKYELTSEDSRTEKTHLKSHHAHNTEESAKEKKEKGVEIPIHRISVTPSHPENHHKKKKSHWLLISIIMLIVVAASSWIASTYFSSATFTIVPKKYEVPVNGTYIAQVTAGSPLSYEIKTTEDSLSEIVSATESASVSTKAQGKVTIYNANSQTQQLVAGSRISNDGGDHVYRLKSSLSIPAKTSSGPGTLVAEIVADKAGESYNINSSKSISDFKFLGYKGTARYETVYARLNTDITGGFVGSKKIVPQATLDSTRKKLEAELTQKLIDQAKTTISEDNITYDNVQVISFSSPTVSGDDPNSANITVKGTINLISFNKKQLIERLVEKEKLLSFEPFSYKSSGLENLDVSIANTKDFSIQKKNSLILKIKGNIDIIGDVPTEEIRSKLAGISLVETKEILKPYSSVIETGSGELIPPWSKVPTDLSRISVIIEDKK